MNTTIGNSLKTLGLALFVACLAGESRAQEGTVFLQADVGGQWTRDIKLNDFFGVPLFPDSKLKLDPGVRVGFAGGYNLTDWFALGGELGFMGNKVDSVTAAVELHDAYVANIPFLANARLQFPNRSRVTPYAGAGIGFSETGFDVDHLAIQDTQGFVTRMHGSDWDTVFAWEAFAGLKFRINDNMEAGVEYRYFTSDGATWHADFVSGTPSDRISFGRVQTHAISAVFVFHF